MLTAAGQHKASETQDRRPAWAFLSGGGELGCLIARHDWASTPVGPIETWPQSLKVAVSLMLRSQVPMVMLWGESGVMIYNDAYSGFAGGRHPQLLGSNVREGWPEVADFNDNVMKVGLAGGTLAYRDQELTLHRSGRPEQVWMNLDYSPLLNEAGEPAGVIAIVVETTAKVAAERWREGERDRQRQMFEQAPGFMAMMTGPDHVFELTNAAYMQLIGHRDVIGRSVREALPEIDGQGYYEILDKVYATGESFIGTALRVEVERQPGAPHEERFLDLVYQPVRGPGGDVFGIFVQGVDVTERLAAESALRRSESQFRTFAESMPNHVWTARPDGLLDWFNPRVYEYSGACRGDLDGEGWAGMVHPDDVAGAAQRWAAALSAGTAYETEFRLRRHDGVYRWHIARAVPIHGVDGAVVQWIGTNTDIDDQKRVAQALHESERRLQLSQHAAGIASLEVDIASGTVMGSDGLWALWGLPTAERIPVSVLEDLVLPEDRSIRSNPRTRADGSAEPTVEYRIRRADTGEVRWLSRHVDFVRDEAGVPVKMFGVMQDVTDRRQALARQQLLTHELEHRIKNILSMVSAIVSQTLRGADIETARAVLNERLRALANVHDILNDTKWTSASMGEVIAHTISAFPADRFTISGPSLPITPRMAISLALAVNELGTNALKYGALSNGEGTVSIGWSVDNAASDNLDGLIWRWRESGGPPVVAPARRGFGSFLIERVLGADFGGTVTLEYNPDGLACTLSIPSAADNADRPATR